MEREAQFAPTHCSVYCKYRTRRSPPLDYHLHFALKCVLTTRTSLSWPLSRVSRLDFCQNEFAHLLVSKAVLSFSPPPSAQVTIRCSSWILFQGLELYMSFQITLYHVTVHRYAIGQCHTTANSRTDYCTHDQSRRLSPWLDIFPTADCQFADLQTTCCQRPGDLYSASSQASKQNQVGYHVDQLAHDQ